jgi:hypothetical protein
MRRSSICTCHLFCEPSNSKIPAAMSSFPSKPKTDRHAIKLTHRHRSSLLDRRPGRFDPGSSSWISRTMAGAQKQTLPSLTSVRRLSNYIEPVVYSAALLDLYLTDADFTMPSIKICIAILALIALAQCHSYVVEARKTVQGTFVGAPGYPRAYGMIHTLRSKCRPATLTYLSQSFLSYV